MNSDYSNFKKDYRDLFCICRLVASHFIKNIVYSGTLNMLIKYELFYEIACI